MKFLFLLINKIIVPGSKVASIFAVVIVFLEGLAVGTEMIKISYTKILDFIWGCLDK